VLCILSVVCYISAGQEYCQLETFEPRCWKNEVIIIDKAVYGRHRIGKCISAKEAAFSQESDYIGCSADVLDIVNIKCAGRKQCQIRVPDADLERTRTCLTGLQMFLEVSYRCLEGKLLFHVLCFLQITSREKHAFSFARSAYINHISVGIVNFFKTYHLPHFMIMHDVGCRQNVSRKQTT